MKLFKKLLEPTGIYFWFLCEIPLAVVLLYTAVKDPAEGYSLSSGNFWLYIPAVLLTALFPMLLNWLKGWLVLHFGKVSCGVIESAWLLCRIHSCMALLEAAGTLAVFLVRNTSAYPVLSQIQLFGHELIYAVLLWGYLRKKSSASYKRCLIVSLACFFASSAWLMLSVIAAL